MAEATVSIKRKIGRPRVDATLIGVTVPPALLSDLDHWIARQPDKPGRPEAIRRLVRQALDAAKGVHTADTL